MAGHFRLPVPPVCFAACSLRRNCALSSKNLSQRIFPSAVCPPPLSKLRAPPFLAGPFFSTIPLDFSLLRGHHSRSLFFFLPRCSFPPSPARSNVFSNFPSFFFLLRNSHTKLSPSLEKFGVVVGTVEPRLPFPALSLEEQDWPSTLGALAPPLFATSSSSPRARCASCCRSRYRSFFLGIKWTRAFSLADDSRASFHF